MGYQRRVHGESATVCLYITMLVFFICAVLGGALAEVEDTNNNRTSKTFSLFSIVQFPNEVCMAKSSTTSDSIYGTCYTSAECTSMGGTADGNCAAGFGVCCIVASTTCGSTISTNTTYIRNPSYPSAYTPGSTSESCTYTINKVQDDICQLRLDFQHFSGITNTLGVCTDTFMVTGQTGVNPPTICGTNTGHHMYVEFGTEASDTAKIEVKYGTTTADKMYNILLRQISCTATWRAPTDCVQYFTGVSGNVQSYNFAGAQLLNSQYYHNCIRTELGYCGVMWQQSSTTSPDPFDMTTGAVTTAASGKAGCANTYISIPGLIANTADEKYHSIMCGGQFGIDGAAVSSALITKTQPFRLGVFTDANAIASPTTGFNLDYTQVPC